jgi:hypothetical protein
LIARAPFWCVVEGMLNGETFPDVFSKRPKWFHPVEELFRSGVAGRGKNRTLEVEQAGSRTPKRQLGSEKQGVNLCDVKRLKYP